MSSMTHRERVLTAFSLRTPDRVPNWIQAGDHLSKLVKERTETDDPAVYFDADYGDRLAFWGTVGTQTTMAFGTPDEVRTVVGERIRTAGRRGGLCIGPSHTLEPPTPWENVVAFFEAVETSGRYD